MLVDVIDKFVALKCITRLIYRKFRTVSQHLEIGVYTGCCNIRPVQSGNRKYEKARKHLVSQIEIVRF